MWNMMCFDTAGLFSRPGGAGGLFKTNTIIEDPLSCRSLVAYIFICGVLYSWFCVEGDIICVEEGSVGSPGFMKTFCNRLENNEQMHK